MRSYCEIRTNVISGIGVYRKIRNGICHSAIPSFSIYFYIFSIYWPTKI